MDYKNLQSPREKILQMRTDFGWDKSQNIAYEYFLSEYFTPTPNDHSKLVKDYKALMAGRIFTFNYDPIHKDSLSWYDRRPIILAIKNHVNTNTGNFLQLGLNFNFIPPEVRTFILELLWKTFRKIITKDLREREEGELIGRQKLLFTDNFDFLGLLEYILDTIGKTNFKFALRQYAFSRVSNAKFVDYLDWNLIPLLKSRDLIGISSRELIKKYWNKKLKNKK